MIRVQHLWEYIKYGVTRSIGGLVSAAEWWMLPDLPLTSGYPFPYLTWHLVALLLTASLSHETIVVAPRLYWFMTFECAVDIDVLDH
jgi:hypothetical protein